MRIEYSNKVTAFMCGMIHFNRFIQSMKEAAPGVNMDNLYGYAMICVSDVAADLEELTPENAHE